MLLTLLGSVAFKKKALEQVKSGLNFNLSLPRWLGKLLNIIRVYFLHPSGRQESGHMAHLTGLLGLANEMETFGKVWSTEICYFSVGMRNGKAGGWA